MDESLVEPVESGILHQTRQQNSTVKLIVGPEEKEFTVAEDVICKRCPFFFNTFSGNFLEAKTKVSYFPDDDPERFFDLCRWLESDELTDIDPDPSWIWLTITWLFAEKYHIDELQNTTVDALYAKYAARYEGINISCETLDFVIENTHRRSPLRRLFSDMLTNGISLEQLPSRVESIPTEFLQEMCVALKRTTSMNNPTDTSLLTNPISSYYVSSAHCKATAMPASSQSNNQRTIRLKCEGYNCSTSDQPLRDIIYICPRHNKVFCGSCGVNQHGHRKRLISLTTPPYKDAITSDSTVIDGHVNDSGFYCDGPKCDPDQEKSIHKWNMIMSGDRYHCLQCINKDYCSLCIRGPLECKERKHSMLRIRPAFAKKIELSGVSIKQKQVRIERGLCRSCGSAEHDMAECEAVMVLPEEHVEVED